jgi:stage III sporulation protein AB
MLKLLGASLVLGTAAIYGYQLKTRLSDHVRQLIALKEIFLLLAGEISYARTPLKEAFGRISNQGKAPFGTFLQEVAERLNEADGNTLYQIWMQVIEARRSEFLLNDDELSILKGLGENLGYLDVKTQMGNIELYIQQIEVRIVQAQQELAAKQKMYQYLSIMCGLFLILILI